MGAYGAYGRLYSRIVVFTNWNSYESYCADLAFNWKEISMPEFIRDVK